MPRPTLTLRGWVVAAFGVAALVAAAWLTRVDLLFIGLLLTVAPLAAVMAIALDRPWLTVSRSYSPDAVIAGQEVQVRLEVRNESPRPAPVLRWRDELPSGFEPVAARTFPSLAARRPAEGTRDSAVTLRYATRARHRGGYLLGPLRVRRTDPFGLARCDYELGDPKLLLVTPRVVELDRGGADEARGDGSEQELVRHSIPSADEVTARDYRAGDPLRRVHWKATARQDRLMVRQEEQRSNPQAWVLLDTVRRRAEGAGHGERAESFERAVELTASISAHLLDLGYFVGVLETGERQLSGGYELPGGDHTLIGELAAIRQTTRASEDHAGRLAIALRRGGIAAPVFLVLADGDPAGWAELAPLHALADPGLAFLTGQAALAARERLEAAGWVCAGLTGATDTTAAWRDAVRQYRARRAGRFEGSGRV